jgi:hypothetical protein
MGKYVENEVMASRHLQGGTDRNHEKYQSRYPVLAECHWSRGIDEDKEAKSVHGDQTRALSNTSFSVADVLLTSP